MLLSWGEVCWSSCVSRGRPAPACPVECHQYQDTVFLQSSNSVVKDTILQRQEEKRTSLNSRSWTSGVMAAISSLFFFLNSPKELVFVLWSTNEAPKHNLARSQAASPGWSGPSPVCVMAPCNSEGCHYLHSTDPRLDKVTMAPLRLRLHTCDAI